ncbi:MAG: hypothetical protein WD489_05965 [Rhodovibrionaceae bacterium]
MQREEAIKRVWDLYTVGNLQEADIQAARILQASQESVYKLPIAEILLSKALLYSLTGRRHKAALFVQKALSRFPASAYPQELMLAMLREELAERNGGTEAIDLNADPAARGRLILGLGTGRCGSTSFTQLLQAQPGGCFSHEHPTVLPWAAATPGLRFHLQRFTLLTQLFDFTGDVAHWWLPSLQGVMSFFPNFRAVVLRRDKQETIESFIKVKEGEGKGSVNHWVAHDGSYWKHVPWDRCYPKYPVKTARDGIARYWDDYYAAAGKLAGAHPDKLRIFDMELLGSPAGQEEILRFCGFENPVLPGQIHANAGTYGEGEDLWGNPFAKPAGGKTPRLRAE